MRHGLPGPGGPGASAGRGGDGATARFRVAGLRTTGRRVNEAIESGLARPGTGVFVCECGLIGCNATIALSRAEYSAVRTSFDRFVVAPRHDAPGDDRVLERHRSYFVVRGREPAAASGDRR